MNESKIKLRFHNKVHTNKKRHYFLCKTILLALDTGKTSLLTILTSTKLWRYVCVYSSIANISTVFAPPEGGLHKRHHWATIHPFKLRENYPNSRAISKRNFLEPTKCQVAKLGQARQHARRKSRTCMQTVKLLVT